MGKTLAIFMVMAMIATGIVLLPTDVEATEQAYTIKGKVLNNVGDAPLAGVTVNITVDSASPKNEVVTTKTDGTFSKIFWLDAAYDFNINFTKVGFNYEHRMFGASDFTVDRIADTNITLLFQQDLVKGTVYEMDTTIPIEGADVYINDRDDRHLLDDGIISTDSNGRFSYYTNEVEIYLNIYKNGFYSHSSKIVVEESSDIIIYMEKITPTPTIEVWGVVFEDETTDTLSGAVVSISAGDDKWISTISDETGHYDMLAYPGNFQIKASRTDYKSTIPEWINVPLDKSLRKNLFLEKTPEETETLSGTITDADGGTPLEADIYLHSTDGKYVNRTTSDETTGQYTMSFYLGSTFVLEVRKDGYFTNASVTGITATTTENVELTEIDNVHTLRGFVFDSVNDKTIEDATVTIYSKEYLYQKTTNTEANGHYEFMVHDNSDFWVLVNAEGYQSIVKNVDGIGANRYLEVGLEPSGTDIVNTIYRFVDWENIEVTRNSIITVNNVSVRMNADRKYGMGDVGLELNDGILSPAEVQEWCDYLKDRGMEQRNTREFLTLNNTYYQLNVTSYEVTIEGANGSISADATIYINSTYNYTLAEELENPESNIFELVLNATYDTEFVDRAYDIILPLAPVKYEMTSNTTETNKVEVTGYNDPITIDPMVHDGNMETVTMTIERSLNGTAKAKVLSGVYHVLNSTYDNYTVIVPMGPSGGTDTTITFSAGDSYDLTGDITKANFTWNFGDGSNESYGMVVEHNYTKTTHDGELTVRLVITETGGNNTYRNITVWVDGQDPMARISALLHDTGNMTFDNANKKLTINEDMPVTFSGIKFSDVEGMDMADVVGDASYDDIKAGDRKGIIDKWFWSWGEEDSFDETVTKDGSNNITHAYSKPGTYTLNMIATDVVGRESANATWTIDVLDITAPVADFNIKNEEGNVVTEVIENRKYYYNASLTTDNYDELANLTFKWFFEIGDTTKEYEGPVINHTFDEVGTFNVTLRATDKANNSENKTIVIHVNLGSRPNILMRLGTMAFDPSPGTAGKAMTISVNITNDGQANASNIQTTFYIRNPDGTDTVIGTDTTDFLGIVGETATPTVTWTPKNKGEYTIWANASCDGEHSSQWWDNKIDDFSVQRVEVQEAGWVMPAIIVSVVVIIILVFFGMKYFMKTGTKEEDYGEKRKKR